jgi:hypothetical protein
MDSVNEFCSNVRFFFPLVSSLLFTDGACFTRYCIMNFLNSNLWAEKNPCADISNTSTLMSVHALLAVLVDPCILL